MPTDFEREPSFAIDDAGQTFLGQRVATAAAGHSGKSGVLLLDDGLDAFVARAVLAQLAERTIDAQYYLYHDDLTGRLFTDHLLAAADRGVRVRLLVDDIDFGGRESAAAALANHPEIEVRVFNPFARGSPRALQFATRYGQITRRMHNKSFTVDNAVAVIGGRNIGDEYFGASGEMNFTDLDALVAGTVVEEVSESFDAFWNSDLSYPVEVLDTDRLSADAERATRRAHAGAAVSEKAYREALKESGLAGKFRDGNLQLEWVDAHLVSDGPEKIDPPHASSEYELAAELRPLFSGTTHDLVIISPYFVPGRAGAAFLAELVSRGVRVRVLTNSLASTDVPVVHAGYARYRRELLRAGVELFEARPGEDEFSVVGSPLGGSSAASLHAKSFVFDRQRVFVGSLNLDPRSIHENTEIGLVIDSQIIASDMIEWFEQFTSTAAWRLSLEETLAGGESITWTAAGESQAWIHEPQTSLWLRVAVTLLRLLPIESQL